MSELQLRIYEIAEGTLDEFVEAWSRGVRPLREQHGFVIEGAWTAPETSEFVWLLRYDGPGSFAEADAAYYASRARTGLDPDPASVITAVSEQMVRPVG